MKDLKSYTVLLAIFSIMASCSNRTKLENKDPEPFCIDEKFKQNIAWIEVSTAPIVEGFQLNGRIESNPNKVVSFNSLLNGIVKDVYFNLGDKVQRGQVLAEFLSTDLSSYRSEISNTTAQINTAKAKLKAVRSLYDDGIAAERELIEAESELSVLQAALRKYQADLGMFSGSSEKGVFQIKAPETGYITAKNINSGMQVSTDSEPLFTVSDLNDVWVMANIYASNMQHIQAGMPVAIRTLSYPDETFSGKISSLSHVLDNESKVLKARIELNNPDHRLKPGMIADVTALRQMNEEMVCIPVNTLVFADNRDHVLVYNDDCNIEIRTIRVAYKNDDKIYISEGLQKGEKIISKNQLLLFNRLSGL